MAASREITYKTGDEHLRVPGRGTIELNEGGSLMAALWMVGDLRVSSLTAALRRFQRFFGESSTQLDLREPRDGRQPREGSQSLGVNLIFEDGRLLISAVAFSEDHRPDADIEEAIRPVLKRYRAKLVDQDSYENDLDDGWLTWLTIETPTRGKTIREVLEVGLESQGELHAEHGDEVFDRDSAVVLLRSGAFHLLVDELESQWLEAKSNPYDLSDERKQFELAKDVAAMANADGGLIILGAQTKATPRGDRIRKVNGCIADHINPRQYRRVLKKRLFPVPEVDVAKAPGPRGRVLGLIEVSGLAKGESPILLKGTSESGLGFTWAVRNGDHTEGPSVETVHATLLAGRSALGQSGVETKASQSELDALVDVSLPLFLQGMPQAARAAGFRVRRTGTHAVFSKAGGPEVEVALDTVGPPADLNQREEALRRLSKFGLPTKRNSRGFLVLT